MAVHVVTAILAIGTGRHRREHVPALRAPWVGARRRRT